MIRRVGSPLATVLLAAAMAACALAPAKTARPADSQLDRAPSSPSRTLVITGSRSPESLASKPLRAVTGSGWPRAAVRAVNAGLVLNDERELPRPYLAQALPDLDTDSWRVFPDGRMETTYRLRPNLAWHDGAPLSAEDFVFAWRVYSSPELGHAGSPPLSYLQDVAAADPQTVVFRWRRHYAEANRLQAADFPALPRHILAAVFVPGEADAFVANAFWLTDYVGLGPYRLSRLDMGALMEVEAFDSHALGRPRIERVRLHFTNDPNTVLATLLADAAHMATTDTIDLEQAAVLERDWVSTQRGVVVRSPVGVRHGNFQLRPEQARPVLLDLRVRKAIVHATNREVLAESLTEGQATIAHALLLPQVEYFADLDRAITKYPYDLRRVEQLFGAAGFSKGTDGFYASPGEGRFSLEVAVAAGARNDKEVAIMADYLRQAGIDASVRVIPRAQIADRQLRLSLTGILNGSFGRAFLPPLQRLRASEIAGPENRWQGSNQSGWSHPEVERLITSYETTLDRVERTQHVIEIMTLVSEQVPIFGLYYNLSFLAHAASLRGPSPYVSDDVANWNIHEWHWAF